MDINWRFLTLISVFFGQLLVSGGQSCNDRWCTVLPEGYEMMEVSEGLPARITCVIPNLPGSTVTIVNHLGSGVLDRSSNVSDYTRLTIERTADVSYYHLNFTWTRDSYVREQLKIIQCIANFQGSTHPCKTSVVNVMFSAIKPRESFMDSDTQRSTEAVERPFTDEVIDSNNIIGGLQSISNNGSSLQGSSSITLVLLLLLCTLLTNSCHS